MEAVLCERTGEPILQFGEEDFFAWTDKARRANALVVKGCDKRTHSGHVGAPSVKVAERVAETFRPHLPLVVVKQVRLHERRHAPKDVNALLGDRPVPSRYLFEMRGIVVEAVDERRSVPPGTLEEP